MCDDFEFKWKGKVYDDWFLPTKDELYQMYKNIYTKGLGNFKYNSYWTSSEDRYAYYSAGVLLFSTGEQKYATRDTNLGVRPIRAF